jgi:hypothetical protein
MKKSTALIALAIAAASVTAQAADQPKTDPTAFWKDTANCSQPAKVVSTKAAKLGGHDGVLVTVKLAIGGKLFTSSVEGAKLGDFKPGSAFCAQDYSGD